MLRSWNGLTKSSIWYERHEQRYEQQDKKPKLLNEQQQKEQTKKLINLKVSCYNSVYY